MIKKSVIKILICALIQLTLLVVLNPVYASEIHNPNAIYEMYKTENVYHVLKLNTRTGQITQVQIGVGKDGWAMENTVNSKSLVAADEEQNGRFALYPTGNMYNFVLLDRISGKTWQVQWHTKPDLRYITRIL